MLRHSALFFQARVAKWQTQRTQNPPPARACRFESDLGHHPDIQRSPARAEILSSRKGFGSSCVQSSAARFVAIRGYVGVSLVVSERRYETVGVRKRESDAG